MSHALIPSWGFLAMLCSLGDLRASASEPVPRSDENSRLAHQQLLEKAKTGRIDLYFLGDSITRRWGCSDPQYEPFLKNWTSHFHGWNAGNFGWGGDGIQNILWRVQNGELDGVHPKVIVLLAGTNNVGSRPGGPAKIVEVCRGLETLLAVCREKAPGAKIILTGILPRNDDSADPLAVFPEITAINEKMARLADGVTVFYVNINEQLANSDGSLREGMMVDNLHPSEKGYDVWAAALAPLLQRFLGARGAQDSAPPPTADPSVLDPSRGLVPAEPLSLWYRSPAALWVEALPIGNGRLGAMIFGGVDAERIQLNEGTIWAGGPYAAVNSGAKAAIPEVRRLITEQRFEEATRLIDREVIGRPSRQMPYQTAGDLLLECPGIPKAEHYLRTLNINTAISTVTFKRGSSWYRREVFASAPDNVIVARLTADRSGEISFTARMASPMETSVVVEGGDTLVLRGRGGDSGGVAGRIKYQIRVRILANGGRMEAGAESISVKAADEVIILIAAATNFRRFDDLGGDAEGLAKDRLANASGKSFDELRAAHLTDYQSLFRRVSLDFGASSSASLPTNERIQRFGTDYDPQFAALYYQFARYLLISCSRPGGQPATLQGLWNDMVDPPWQSKYTININTEMNYWPAESGNLAECVDPLIEMVGDLAATGARTAREMYDARGWVAHHNTDLWRATAPIDGANWGMWPTGGAWLALHLWDRYEFSRDKSYLQRIYPTLKAAAEFFLDTLQEEAEGGFLVTNPSISPENIHPMGAAVCAGPTMDNQILRDLFANTVKAAKTLCVDEEFQKRLSAARSRLAPNQIGKAGQLQEWFEDWDMQAGDLHHRHVSHLYGLFPGRDIHRRDTPELANAVKKSLELRGDKATGWATAWRICLWAHLGDGDRAYAILRLLLGPELTYPNLFDAHPPFQIDGNFGGATGISEMLLQSRIGTVVEAENPAGRTEIELLPALPTALPEGQVRGLCTRGGCTVDLMWKDGKLTTAFLRSTSARKMAVTVLYGSLSVLLDLQPGEEVALDATLRRTTAR